MEGGKDCSPVGHVVRGGGLRQVEQAIFALQHTDAPCRTVEETHYQSKLSAEKPGCMLRGAKTWLGVKVIVFFCRGKSLEFMVYTLI